MPSWITSLCIKRNIHGVCIGGEEVTEDKRFFKSRQYLHIIQTNLPSKLFPHPDCSGSENFWMATFIWILLNEFYNSFLMGNFLKCLCSCFTRHSRLNGTHFENNEPSGIPTSIHHYLVWVQFVHWAHLVAQDPGVDTDCGGVWAGGV